MEILNNVGQRDLTLSNEMTINKIKSRFEQTSRLSRIVPTSQQSKFSTEAFVPNFSQN